MRPPRDRLAALLPIEKRVLGRTPANPGRPRRTGHLDRGGGGSGWARDQLAALLPVRERVSGAEYPDTLSDRAGLAYWTGAAGMQPAPATS
jgi:hypothetical protein